MKTQTQQPSGRRLFSLDGAVDYIGGEDVLKKKTLQQWAWMGKLATIKIGGRVCVEQAELDRIIERGRRPARD